MVAVFSFWFSGPGGALLTLAQSGLICCIAGCRIFPEPDGDSVSENRGSILLSFHYWRLWLGNYPASQHSFEGTPVHYESSGELRVAIVRTNNSKSYYYRHSMARWQNRSSYAAQQFLPQKPRGLYGHSWGALSPRVTTIFTIFIIDIMWHFAFTFCLHFFVRKGELLWFYC